MKRITRLTNSADQDTTDDGELTLLTFDTKVKSVPASTYAPADSSKIFVRQAGAYAGRARANFEAFDGGTLRTLVIRKNGTVIVGKAQVAAVPDPAETVLECGFDAEDCAAGDYFQVLAAQDSGEVVAIKGGGGQDDFPGFAVWRVDA